MHCWDCASCAMCRAIWRSVLASGRRLTHMLSQRGVGVTGKDLRRGRSWAMSEFSACFWGWLANLEKCQADKRQHTGRRRSCCLLGPGPQTTTTTAKTNKQMPRQAKSRKTINENKQREMRSEKKTNANTGRESTIGDCGLRSFVVACFGATRLWRCACSCGSVAASIVIIYLCPKTFHFHFHLAKGVNAAG